VDWCSCSVARPSTCCVSRNCGRRVHEATAPTFYSVATGRRAEAEITRLSLAVRLVERSAHRVKGISTSSFRRSLPMR
jgi:hypothetical protein